MIVETEITVSAAADRVWQELSDLELLAAAIPGSQMKRVDGDSLVQGPLRPEFGGAAVDCVGTLRAIDLDEDERSASCRFHVRQARGAAFAVGLLRGQVSGDDGSARVSLALDGRLAAPGLDERSVSREADELIATLAAGLEKSLTERASRAPAPKLTADQTAHSADAAPPAAALPDRESHLRQRVGLAVAGLVALLLALLFGARKRRGSARFERPW
jgi:carbon monoxide dehydrogenase subunit G